MKLNLNYFLIIALIMMAFISCKTSVIVGTWRIVDYEDNLIRTSADSAKLSTSIERLKENAKFVIKRNHEFVRFGFTNEPERGKWKIDEKEKFLYLKPNEILHFDSLQCLDLTNEKLTIIVNEKVDTQLVTTKIYFIKVKDERSGH